ncbi:MAG: hypothetical protein AAGU05_04685, partial [Anaerolineaceae bacterium]
EAFTTLESAERFHKIAPNLPVLGVEIDPERVQAALPYEDELTRFRLGGFHLPLQPGETVKIIRAFNVLRQYEEAQVPETHALLMDQLLPGGLLIEGTSDPFGRLWTANVLRKAGPAGEPPQTGLLFSTNFQGLKEGWFDPAIFQAVLSKNYIHRMLPGEPIHEFMQTWKMCARQTVSLRTLGLRQWFAETARCLAGQGYRVDVREKYLKLGYLFWVFSEDRA